MVNCSILGNIVNYVQYDRNPKNFHELNIKVLDQKSHRKMYDKLKDDKRQRLDIDFGGNPDKLREYLDMYEGVQSEVLNTTRFDESSDLSTTYLGGTDITRENTIINAEENCAISEQGCMVGKLLYETECQILIDTGASSSYMAKSYYLRYKLLHSMP